MKSRPLTEQEITAILAHMPSLRDQALFVLGCKTGFRISELLSLTVSDVSQKDGTICDSVTVRRCNMKGKRSSRTVPVHRDAQMCIKTYIMAYNLCTAARLFPICRQYAWYIIREAALRANVQGAVSTHSMRKTLGMKVYIFTGNNVVAAQRALGHASLASTTHYLSIGQEEVDAAILA